MNNSQSLINTLDTIEILHIRSVARITGNRTNYVYSDKVAYKTLCVQCADEDSMSRFINAMCYAKLDCQLIIKGLQITIRYQWDASDNITIEH